MQLHRLARLLWSLTFVLVALPTAHAAIITKGISGSVTSALADNSIGLKEGDLLSGSITFDSGLLTGAGFEILTPDTDPTLKLEIRIGAFRFVETDDIGFSEFPGFEFLDGQIVDIDFVAAVDNETRFAVGDRDDPRTFVFQIGEFNVQVSGVFSFFDPAAIPEPGTLAVFSIGLAGMGLLRRRRNCVRAA